MTLMTLDVSPRSYARTAGLLYLIIAVCGGFSIGYVPSVIISDAGNAATLQNLTDNQNLFRLGVLGDTIVLLAEIILIVMLYVLFKPVSPTLSMVAAFSRLSMIMVMAVNLLINIIPLILLGDPVGYSDDQLALLTGTLFKAHAFGVYIWGMLFGLHLMALGYLVIKSGYVPRVLGWMMLIGSFGYSIEGLSKITLIQSELIVTLNIALLTIVTIGELSFALWLLVKGLNISGNPTGNSVAQPG